MNLDQMVAKSEKFDESKIDYVEDVNKIEFNPMTGAIQIPTPFGPKAEAEMTDWSLGQICQKLGGIPKKYMDKCPSVLRAINLGWWAKQSREKWLVRTHENKARAVLSAGYVVISNTSILHKVSNLLMGKDIDLIDPYISPDVLHVKIAMADNEHYRVGVYVGNGEIGNRQVCIRPFFQRTSCTNSITFRRGGFEHRHIHSTDSYLYGAIQENVGQSLRLADEYLDRFVKAEMDKIPQIGDVIDRLCKSKGYSKVTRDNVLIGTEGMNSRMGLVNAFSYAAHAGGLGIKEQTDMEEFAGELLFARR